MENRVNFLYGKEAKQKIMPVLIFLVSFYRFHTSVPFVYSLKMSEKRQRFSGGTKM